MAPLLLPEPALWRDSVWCSEPFGFTVYGDTPVSVSHVFVILRWRREHPHPVFLEQCPMTFLFKGLTQSGRPVLLWFFWERNNFILFHSYILFFFKEIILTIKESKQLLENSFQK